MKSMISLTGRDAGEALGRSATRSAKGAGSAANSSLVGGAQRLDVVAAEAAALHADDVEPGEPRAVAHHRPKGMTSRSTPDMPPIIACWPMRTN